jgi:hypothetical protein
VINPDGGSPVDLGSEGERLLAMDFKNVRLSEMLGQGEGLSHTLRSCMRFLNGCRETSSPATEPAVMTGFLSPRSSGTALIKCVMTSNWNWR